MKKNTIIIPLVLFICNVSIAFSSEITEEYSTSKSISLASEVTGKKLESDIQKMEINFRSQYQLSPYIPITEQAEKIIYNKEYIHAFFEALWHPLNHDIKWQGSSRSIVFRFYFEDKTIAYYHMYLKKGSVPRITPFTASDAASYDCSNILEYLKSMEFSFQ